MHVDFYQFVLDLAATFRDILKTENVQAGSEQNGSIDCVAALQG